MEILSSIGTLIMLIVLQVVLGFDNLLYIALESKKALKKSKNMLKDGDFYSYYSTINITLFVGESS